MTAGSADASDKQVLDPDTIRAELARGSSWAAAKCWACGYGISAMG